MFQTMAKVQTWWSVPYPLANELRTNYGSDFKHLAMAVNQGDHKITIYAMLIDG